MTIGEVVRQVESYNRVTALKAKEQAIYDYIQAGLIVRGVSITLGSKESYPTLQDTYSGLFNEETQEQAEKIEQRKIELSVLRFKQFAQSYNKKFKNKEVLLQSE